MKKSNQKGIFLALLAAALYAVNIPFSKLLLSHIPPTISAGLLYLGAGLSMAIIAPLRKIKGRAKTEKFTRKELPYTIAMILLDVAAPIFLLFGIKYTEAANASLLNNFEIVATALIALCVFKEKISTRLWFGILFVTASCILLTVGDVNGIKFNFGSLFILASCVCWGLENNCTRKLSNKDPLQIVLLKGVFSGTTSLLIGFIIGEKITVLWSVFAMLGVGIVAYGLSIFFYVHAQRLVGAARTSVYYAIAPFISATLSIIIFNKFPHYTYCIALFVMIIGAYLCSDDKPLFKKKKQTN